MGIAQIASTASYRSSRKQESGAFLTRQAYQLNANLLSDSDLTDSVLSQQSNRYAHGALSLVQSLVMLIDAGIQVYKYRQETM